MRRLIPDTILARTLLVLIVGLTVSHMLSMGLYLTDRNSATMFTNGRHIGERIARIERFVSSTPSAERRNIVDLANDSTLRVTLTADSALEDRPNSGWKARILRDVLVKRLDRDQTSGFRLRYEDRVAGQSPYESAETRRRGIQIDGQLMVSIRLPDGSWLNFLTPVERPEPLWSPRFGLSMVVMLVAVGLLSALVAYHLTKPLAVFARAAQRLGVDVKAPPIPEIGPAEVRQATRAFNEMQDRIRRFVEDRTQMVAAISHDLGTPITRLRLRAEFIDDDQQRQKVLDDLDDMEKMVFATLSFARDEATSEPRVMIDLRTLLQRVCNDMADAGHTITLDIGDEAVPYGCRPAALRRALTNLIDNAIKYGHQACVSLKNDHLAVVVRIDDSGPGIPDDLQEDVFMPFRRLDPSRNRETGGTGLGLTVARTIIRAHGGDVTLVSRSEGGLRAEMRLPR